MKKLVCGLLLATLATTTPAVAASTRARGNDVCAALRARSMHDACPTTAQARLDDGGIDAIVCPVLAELAMIFNDPNLIFIDWTGDVYVLGEFFWDCPPYEW